MSFSIPEYPDTRPIEISDKSLLQGYFKALQPTISELSFANLFLFRHLHRYSLTMVANGLTIFGSGYDGQEYFLPPLCGDAGEVTRSLLVAGKTLYGADERFIAEWLSGFPCTLLADRDNDDYLYLRKDLADLPGNRFHKKKNRINYFAVRQKYRVEPFCRDHRESALQLLAEWDRVHNNGLSRSVLAESAATREGVERADELGLSGVVVLTDRGVTAFALGEKLNDTTFVCHFEKADPFLEGAAQLVNREFSRLLPEEYLYVNREQDLGESGLKAAKSSYHPVGMIQKYRVKRVERG